MSKSFGSPGSQYGFEMQGQPRPSDFSGAQINSGPPLGGAEAVGLEETGRLQRCRGHIRDPHNPVAYGSPYDPGNCHTDCDHLAACALAKEGRLSHCLKEGSEDHSPSAFGDPFDPEECRGCSGYRNCSAGFKARENHCVANRAYDPRGHGWPFSAYHGCNGCPNRAKCVAAEAARNANCKVKGEARKGQQPEKHGYPFCAKHAKCMACTKRDECDPASAEVEAAT